MIPVKCWKKTPIDVGYFPILVGGWALPLWKMMEFVSWDDDIPNWMESHKIHVPNHQPDHHNIPIVVGL